MNIAGLIPLLQAHPQYRRLRDQLSAALAEANNPKSKIQNLKSDDLLDAAKPLLLAALAADPAIPARRIVIITARAERAKELAAALDLYAPAEQAVWRFPAPDLLPYERIAPDPTITASRLEVLAALQWTVDSGQRTEVFHKTVDSGQGSFTTICNTQHGLRFTGYVL